MIDTREDGGVGWGGKENNGVFKEKGDETTQERIKSRDHQRKRASLKKWWMAGILDSKFYAWNILSHQKARRASKTPGVMSKDRGTNPKELLLVKDE